LKKTESTGKKKRQHPALWGVASFKVPLLPAKRTRFYQLTPKSCTSENEKDNLLFYIKVLCKKQKRKFIHR